MRKTGFCLSRPALNKLVGRSSQIIGERWDEIADSMRLDPVGRVSQALAGQDTWSGYTAWWPTDDNLKARIPAELTALPVFAIDQIVSGLSRLRCVETGRGIERGSIRQAGSRVIRWMPSGGRVACPATGREIRKTRTPAGVRAEAGRPMSFRSGRAESRLPEFARSCRPRNAARLTKLHWHLKTHDELRSRRRSPISRHSDARSVAGW